MHVGLLVRGTDTTVRHDMPDENAKIHIVEHESVPEGPRRKVNG